MESVTPEDAIQGAISAMIRDVWTCLPARIVSVDLAKSQISAQPFPADHLGGAVVPLPQVQGVPVLWPRAGAASITLPLAAGDMVLLLISSRALSVYRDGDGEGDPETTRTHDLSDAMALPMGLWADSSAVVADATHMVVAKPSGGQVRLGAASGTKAVARDGDVVDMGAGPGQDWISWAYTVTAALNAVTGGAIIPPTALPPIKATSTDVEAS